VGKVVVVAAASRTGTRPNAGTAEIVPSEPLAAPWPRIFFDRSIPWIAVVPTGASETGDAAPEAGRTPGIIPTEAETVTAVAITCFLIALFDGVYRPLVLRFLTFAIGFLTSP
jgi:hypothetical protein